VDQNVYGCTNFNRHRYALGPVSSGGSAGGAAVAHETLAGPIAAYGHVVMRGSIGEWTVVVRDLRNGRVLRREPTGVAVKPEPFSVGIGSAVAIVVKSDGSVAWIVETRQENGEYQVHAVDRTGSRILAVGADVAPSSLALAGSTLYWTQGSKPVSAALD
jgi:hypothetical protein